MPGLWRILVRGLGVKIAARSSGRIAWVQTLEPWDVDFQSMPSEMDMLSSVL